MALTAATARSDVAMTGKDSVLSMTLIDDLPDRIEAHVHQAGLTQVVPAAKQSLGHMLLDSAVADTENFGDLVYNTRIRKTVRFAEAPVKGSSVLAYEPAGEAAELYRDLAKEVLGGQKSRQHA